MGEHYTAQPNIRRGYSQTGQTHPGPGGDNAGRLIHRYLLEGGGGNHQTVHPLICHQKIGPASQQQHRPSPLLRQAQQQYGLLRRSGQDHPAGRPADAEGGVKGHRLLTAHLHLGQLFLSHPVKVLIPEHSTPPIDYGSCIRVPKRLYASLSSAAPIIPASLPKRALTIRLWRSAIWSKRMRPTRSRKGRRR